MNEQFEVEIQDSKIQMVLGEYLRQSMLEIELVTAENRDRRIVKGLDVVDGR